MAQTNVSFEMNEKLRDNLAELCDELGMSIDDAFQLFARKMVNEQGIPFEVTEKEYPVDEGKETVVKVVKIVAAVSAAIAALAALCHLIRFLCRRR